MYPQQPQGGPSPYGNNYDFILNPQQPRRRLLGGDPFITKIVVIIGGAVAVMVVAALAINLFLGGKANTDAYVGLLQSEQELVRLSDEGDEAVSQTVKNAAANTSLSITSHQQEWKNFLAGRGREVKDAELGLKKSANADTKLENARQAGAFEATYVSTMRALLEGYAGEIRAAFDSTSSERPREILSQQFDEIELLLKQWPE